MNKITLILLLLSSIVMSQIFIGEPVENTSSMLNINTTDKVFVGPKVYLKSSSDHNNPIKNVQIGSMVYNLTNNEDFHENYYYWNGNKWVEFMEIEKKTIIKNVSSIGLNNLLGYGDDADELIYTGETGRNPNNIVCKEWSGSNGNGHTYCLVKDVNQNWSTSFNDAKNNNGYLATITSEEELNFIETSFSLNSLSTYTDYDVALGFRYVYLSSLNASNGVNSKGKFQWITGEETKVNWKNDSSQFLTINNVNFKNDYCGFYNKRSKITTKLCSTKSKYYIIEYNESL